MTEICEVVVTAPDSDWLARFTRQLVDQRLCAAGHNIERVRSIYRWKGEVRDHAEARVAFHTRRDLVPTIAERVRAEHPYEVACVVSFEIQSSDPAYLRWVLEETADPDV